jgi:hypothetical protein
VTPWRLLLLIPAAAVVILGGVPLFTPLLGHDGAARLILTAASVAGAVGLFRAAGGFARGDYMRSAWLLLAASYALIAIEFPLRRSHSVAGYVVGIAFVCAINGLIVAGMVRFSRAFAVSGLELIGSRTRNRIIVAAAVLIAVALAGLPLYRSARSVLAGDLAEIDAIVSSLGDLFLLACVAPLLLSTLALRGGLLVWPWALLTASSVAWLLFDTQTLVPVLLPGLAPATLQVWSELWQGLACVMAGVAGLAQRRLTSGQTP